MATNLVTSDTSALRREILAMMNTPFYGQVIVIPLFPAVDMIQTPDDSIGRGSVVNAATAPILFNGFPLECYHEDQVPGYNPIVPNTGGRRKRQ